MVFPGARNYRPRHPGNGAQFHFSNPRQQFAGDSNATSNSHIVMDRRFCKRTTVQNFSAPAPVLPQKFLPADPAVLSLGRREVPVFADAQRKSALRLPISPTCDGEFSGLSSSSNNHCLTMCKVEEHRDKQIASDDSFAVTKVMFVCEPCDKTFAMQEQYVAHYNSHTKCSFPGCSFQAGNQIVMKHYFSQHTSGNIDTADNDSSAWINARKRKFPTNDQKIAKQQAEVDRMDRGDVLVGRNEFGKFKVTESRFFKTAHATDSSASTMASASSTLVGGSAKAVCSKEAMDEVNAHIRSSSPLPSKNLKLDRVAQTNDQARRSGQRQVLHGFNPELMRRDVSLLEKKNEVATLNLDDDDEPPLETKIVVHKPSMDVPVPAGYEKSI